jgi:predicted lipoprotein with Yx(FWY)xxD motif
MKRIHILGGVLAAAALAGGGAALGATVAGPDLAAATAAPAPSSSVAAPPGIGTAALAPGTALVDGTDRALYLFEADTGTTSTCVGVCAGVWPPLTTPGALPATTGDARTALVGTTRRSDGTTQVTYAGHPLYHFAADIAPGDVKGQGVHNFGGGWYVVTPAGQKIDTDDAPAAPAAPPSPAAAAPRPSAGTGYGY